MIILLSLIESESQLISGVPEFVEFVTNIPSTVFYTLDGSMPDEESLMASGRLYLPTDGKSFTLKAIAISDSISSDLLEKSYFTDTSELERTRLIDKEGINVLPFGVEPIDSLSFDSEGNPAQETTIEYLDLEIKTSTTNAIGEPLADKTLETETTTNFINIPKKNFGQDRPHKSSVNHGEFDPKAAVILIDGSTSSLLNSQTVKIINRPMGTINVQSSVYNDHNSEMPLVTGNIVRQFYNPKTKKIVFYYRESRENRWVVSTQQVESATINTGKGLEGSKYVFRWIEDRSMSKIY